MTVAETAKQLEVSTSLVYQLCYSGQLPYIRFGNGRGRILISQGDVDALLAAGRVEAGEPGLRRAPRSKRAIARDHAALIAEAERQKTQRMAAWKAKKDAKEDAKRKLHRAHVSWYLNSGWRVDIERWKKATKGVA